MVVLPSPAAEDVTWMTFTGWSRAANFTAVRSDRNASACMPLASSRTATNAGV